MNGTNVDYYASGFDAEGKRVGSLICDFDPTKEKNADKLAAFKGKAKELFDGAVIVDIITAEDYNLYLTGDYIRGAAGKPVPYAAPEPTAEEKKAARKAALQIQYEANKKNLMKYYLSAAMAGDMNTQTDLKQELADLDAQFDTDVKTMDE